MRITSKHLPRALRRQPKSSAAKKMEKAKCAFDDANRKAQIAAEKLQRAEKLLQVASVLETDRNQMGGIES